MIMNSFNIIAGMTVLLLNVGSHIAVGIFWMLCEDEIHDVFFFFLEEQNN